MHVKSLSQGLNVDLAQPGLEPGTSCPEAKCLALDHNATIAIVNHQFHCKKLPLTHG